MNCVSPNQEVKGKEKLTQIPRHLIISSDMTTWKFINWNLTEKYSVEEIKTYFMQEVFKRGVLVLSTHNITLAHTPKIITRITDVYSEVFSELHRVLESQTLRQELTVEPLKPLFKVR